MSQLMPIPEVTGVFSEAFLLDDHSETVFISFIGKDTAIQAFRASWSIPASQGGLTDFLVETQQGTPRIHLGNPENMEFQSGRINTNLFGELVQVWVFKHLAQKPDYANRKAIQLYRLDEDKAATQDNLWALVKDLSHLPLLDEWRPVIVDLLFQKDWIKHWQGVGGIAAHYIHLPEEVMDALLQANIQSGALLADEGKDGLLIASDKQTILPAKPKSKPKDEATTTNDFWADAEVIHTYIRKQAIEEGYLIDVSTLAKEAGFVVPVAITREVWTRYVEWSEEKGSHQDETGRLWDVLFMAFIAMRGAKTGGTQLLYKLNCVPCDDSSPVAQEVELKIDSGPGDEGEHVITIMLPNES